LRFLETALYGAFIIELEEQRDARGLFARTFCSREFEAHGLDPVVAQCNLSITFRRGTLRGMHYQAEPAGEAKLVRCVAGSIHDVMIDLRPNSPTFRQHVAAELSGENGRALYIPKGFAHGFQSLSDNAMVLYQMSECYSPELARGVRYNDPAFDIMWPLPVSEIAERDANWPLLETARIECTQM
jgi:dTDP-4-dehydrorhamnose 3,5-epimerase